MRIDGRVRAGLAGATRFTDIRVLDEVDSTNRWAADAARRGEPEGLVVVADRQLAGRGRAGRRWEAPAGSALLVSVLLRPEGLAVDRLHLVTAAVGLAAAAAIEAEVGTAPELKWPNDLLVGERKLAGILAEAVGIAAPGAGATGAPGGGSAARGPGSPGAVVVGIGINVSAAPQGATCVEDLAAGPVDRAGLLDGMLRRLEARLGDWDAVGEEYRSRCATVGRRVRVEGPPGVFLTGTATRVEPDGRLVVVGDGRGTETVLSAADVTHLRPAPPGGAPPGA